MKCLANAGEPFFALVFTRYFYLKTVEGMGKEIMNIGIPFGSWLPLLTIILVFVCLFFGVFVFGIT